MKIKQDHIKQYLNSPSEMSLDYKEDIKTIHQKYPYSQTFMLMHLKMLQESNDIDYQSFLKKTAVSVIDRENLYQLIFRQKIREEITEIEGDKVEENTFNESSVVETKGLKKQSLRVGETSEVKKVEETNKAPIDELEKQILAHAVTSTLEYEVEKDLVDKQELIPISSESEVLEKNKVQSVPNEMGFTQWLFVNDVEVKSVQEDKTIDELVDDFLHKKSEENANKEFFNPDNLAKMSVVENDDFVTETLVDVYIGQKRYTKAIEALENLSLKNPKKKTYFADRIKELKNKL